MRSQIAVATNANAREGRCIGDPRDETHVARSALLCQENGELSCGWISSGSTTGPRYIGIGPDVSALSGTYVKTVTLSSHPSVNGVLPVLCTPAVLRAQQDPEKLGMTHNNVCYPTPVEMRGLPATEGEYTARFLLPKSPGMTHVVSSQV